MTAVVLGTVSSLLYALVMLGRGDKPDLGNAVGLFVSWFGVATGVRVCVISFYADNLGVLTPATDRAYVFLVGGVLIWVGLAGVGRAFRPLATGREEADRTREAVDQATEAVDAVDPKRDEDDSS